MQDFLRNHDCLKQADRLACNGRPDFVKLLEPGFQNKAQLMERNFTVSSAFSGLQKTIQFLSGSLLNKFSECTKKLEEIQKHCPESEKIHLSEQISYLSGVLENAFELCSMVDVDEKELQRFLTEHTELLMQNFIKTDKLPELAQEDLQILGDFETILPPEDWLEVMDSACELLGDFEIMNDTTVQLSAHQNHQSAENFQMTQPVETVEKSLEKWGSIGQEDRVAASTSRSSSPASDSEKDLRYNANYQNQKEIDKDEEMKNYTVPKPKSDRVIPRCQGENAGINFVRRSPRFQNRRG